jgi:hypothetical protein
MVMPFDKQSAQNDAILAPAVYFVSETTNLVPIKPDQTSGSAYQNKSRELTLK